MTPNMESIAIDLRYLEVKEIVSGCERVVEHEKVVKCLSPKMIQIFTGCHWRWTGLEALHGDWGLDRYPWSLHWTRAFCLRGWGRVGGGKMRKGSGRVCGLELAVGTKVPRSFAR